MRHAVMVAGIVAGCFVGNGHLVAQERPDFSGEWALVTNVGSQIDSPLGRRASVSQSGSALTITDKNPQGSRTRTYRLDGTEARSNQSAEQVLLSRTRWVSNALLITTRPETAPKPWEDLLVLALNSEDVLTVSAASACTCRVETGTTFAIYRRLN